MLKTFLCNSNQCANSCQFFQCILSYCLYQIPSNYLTIQLQYLYLFTFSTIGRLQGVTWGFLICLRVLVTVILGRCHHIHCWTFLESAMLLFNCFLNKEGKIKNYSILGGRHFESRPIVPKIKDEGSILFCLACLLVVK